MNNSELPKGYKPTEVGVIPEDWNVVSVQKLVETQILEKPLDGNHGNIHPKSSDYVSYGIPFVMANNFANGQVDIVNCKFITKEKADKLQKGFSIAGDVLLTHKGTVGSTAIVGELSTAYVMLTPQVTYYRVIDTNRLNNLFVRHYFDSQPFQSLFINLAGGGTRAYLGIVKQLALPVIIPPLPEQRSIATALSDMDELLGGLDRLIAKKRDLKQATMQQLLTGKTRLPGFGEGKGYKQTEIGAMPEDWSVKQFAKVTDIITCGIAATPEYVSENQGYPFLSSTNVKDGQIIWSAYKYITINLHRQLYRNNPPRRGDILYSRVGTIGEAAVIDVNFEFSIYVSLTLIKPGELLDSFFLMHLLNSTPYKKRAKEQVYLGGGVGNLNVDVVRKYPIVLPPLPEQTAIASILSDMDTEIAAIEQRRSKTRDLKQAMMQELLTGRTRLR